ncbi:MAG TPA: CehA/McbA family metallohydrolase [Candidatus Limnocylindria bacterium]|nr:CehA/McbA family metallohydrolase [Candidatus Limnocylindria bacterium]
MSDLGEPDRALAGHFDRTHEKRYAHVPFEVPRGVHQLHLRYSYDDRIGSDPTLSGGNTLDIGLFDQRGIAAGSPGFRGWSGSEKLELTIDEGWATPPYAAGPIAAGTWHVLLGPYKVGPRGCDWAVRIWFDAGIPSPVRTAIAVVRRHGDRLPASRRGWIRGDLHCHTLYSDGDSWPMEMLSAAAASGLEFLGVTDHNNVRHQAEYGPGGNGLPLVVPGVEVTTYRGHWNAWGTDRWWEFREPEARAVEATMREAAAAGAVVSVSHPKPLGPPWEYADVTGFHAVEVWNARWVGLNAVALAFWEERLRRGERIAALGGSDTHYLKATDPDPRHSQRLGTPTTWIDAGEAPTVASILAALREGRAFVSVSPRGPQLYLEPDPARSAHVRVEALDASGCTLALLSDSGAIHAAVVAASPWDGSVEVPRGTRYVRAQLLDAYGEVRALTNPVWAERL